MRTKLLTALLSLLGAILAPAAHADCNRPSTTYERQDCNFKNERDFRRGNSEVDQKARDYLQSLKQNSEDEEQQRRAQAAENARRAAEANAQREAQAKRDQQEQNDWQRRVTESKRNAAKTQGLELLLREMTARRLDALTEKAARAGAKGKLTAADYEAAISTAWPYLDLMQPWVERAAARLGGRFELLQGLVAWQGCPEIDRFEQALNYILDRTPRKCDERYHDDAVQRLHRAMANAPRYDRLMVCWLDLKWQRNFFSVFRTDTESAGERKSRLFYEDCRKQLADIPASEVDAFIAMAKEAPAPGYMEHTDFFLFFHPDRESVNTTDLAAMRRIIVESRLHEVWLRTTHPNQHLAREKEARELGVRYHWPIGEAEPPIGLGPMTAKEIGFRGDKTLGVLPISPNAAVPDRSWQNWDGSNYQIAYQAEQQRQAGNHALALRFAEMQMAQAQQADGPNSGRISDALVNIAYTLEAMKRPIEAEKAFRRAFERRGTPENPDDPYVRNAKTHYAQFLSRRNQPAAAQAPAPSPQPAALLPPAPKEAAKKTIAGRYSAQGKNPDGSVYSAAVTIEQQAKGYRFVWNFSQTTMQGTGDFSDGKLVINWGDNYPAIYTVAENGQLHGTWSNGKASEVLTPVR